MSDLVVIAFPTEQKAEEVRQKLLGMQKDYLVELGDAVIAVKNPDGKVKLNQLVSSWSPPPRPARCPEPSGDANWFDLSDALSWCGRWRRLRSNRRGAHRCWNQ
jgi:hypothetical protein